MVATDAVVVLVSAKPQARAGQRPGGAGRAAAATRNDVAGAALVETVTLTFH